MKPQRPTKIPERNVASANSKSGPSDNYFLLILSHTKNGIRVCFFIKLTYLLMFKAKRMKPRRVPKSCSTHH